MCAVMFACALVRLSHDWHDWHDWLQVFEMKKIVKKLGLTNIKVDDISTVDSVQGRQFNIVIISMVRSTPHDGPLDLWFLNDKYRTNVAYTRPEQLFLIVGDESTLKRNWDKSGVESTVLARVIAEYDSRGLLVRADRGPRPFQFCQEPAVQQDAPAEAAKAEYNKVSRCCRSAC